MRKLISSLYDDSSVIDNLFEQKFVVETPLDILEVGDTENAALILWGGEDISPGIYNQRPAAHFTGAPDRPSLRDRMELRLVQHALEHNIPIIGICRGAQLMCAVSGGSLIQHVDRHAGPDHAIELNDGRLLETNSVHHQMMNPFKVDHELIAWAAPKRSGRYIGDNNAWVEEAEDENFKEAEIVWFPATKALCIQGHPEYSSAPNVFKKLAVELVEKYILTKAH